MEVRFLNHAKKRMKERGLSRSIIASLCEAAAPLLNGQGALRFRIGGHVVVAQKRSNDVIEVVTAWQP